jgi:hypothetical protein
MRKWAGEADHIFLQDDICAFGFNDLLSAGTHASCFNNSSIGVEMVGEFDREKFESGPGAKVADNAIYLLALLHNKIGLTPKPYAYDKRGLHFHVECKHDNHNCPGRLVHKPDVVARVQAKMKELAASYPQVLRKRRSRTIGTSPALPKATIDKICAEAKASKLARYKWKGKRGRAPIGYIKGMAVVFAVVYAKFKAGDPAAVAMAAADTGKARADALTWYRARFKTNKMSNDVAGADTLRHLFVLMTGLGMRESSGRYCEGRDRSAHNVTSDTAEAGLFQMSWNAHVASSLIKKLFSNYSKGLQDFLPIFQEGAVCGHQDFANYGDGVGAAFQQLCKSCPAFAVEAAAVGLRVIRTHWGPINHRAAEIRSDADELYQRVQSIIDIRSSRRPRSKSNARGLIPFFLSESSLDLK